MKNKVGRPRITLDALPKDWKEKILQMSAVGMSDVEIRAKLCLTGAGKTIKFHQKTWDSIKAREEEFLLTLQIGKILCEAWWREQGRTSLKREYYQTGLWYANMKNRFHWRDKEPDVIDNSTHYHFLVEAIKARRDEEKSKVNRVDSVQTRRLDAIDQRVRPVSV
jgi:hypothetical protein